MKHKYLILKNDEKNELTIQEFAELEKQDEYTLLCGFKLNASFIIGVYKNEKITCRVLGVIQINHL